MEQIRPGVVRCYRCQKEVPNSEFCLGCGAPFDIPEYELFMEINNLPDPESVRPTSIKRLIRRVADQMNTQVRIREGSCILLAAYLNKIAAGIANGAVLFSRYEGMDTVKARHVREAISEQPEIERLMTYV